MSFAGPWLAPGLSINSFDRGTHVLRLQDHHSDPLDYRSGILPKIEHCFSLCIIQDR